MRGLPWFGPHRLAEGYFCLSVESLSSQGVAKSGVVNSAVGLGPGRSPERRLCFLMPGLVRQDRAEAAVAGCRIGPKPDGFPERRFPLGEQAQAGQGLA
jgi:hypothetical protein